MLKADGLCKRFGALTALDQLNLEVREREVYCLLGANGAGKTTTVNLFLGFLRPDGGRAFIGDVEVARDPAGARRKLAYVPESVRLYDHLTGLENLAYFGALAMNRRVEEARLLDALAEAGLDRAAALRRAAGYSKGMRQKVAIALAFLKGADALILDEPTSGLDPQAASDLSELIRRRVAAGTAALLVTHDIFRAKELGTRVGIMKHGRLVAELSADQISHTDLERIYLEHMKN